VAKGSAGYRTIHSRSSASTKKRILASALEALALGHQLLLGARGWHAQESLGENAGRPHHLERARQALELPFHALEMIAHEAPVVRRRVEPGQRPAEPGLGLLGRERQREHADQLGLEIVRLVDDQEPATA